MDYYKKRPTKKNKKKNTFNKYGKYTKKGIRIKINNELKLKPKFKHHIYRV